MNDFQNNILIRKAKENRFNNKEAHDLYIRQSLGPALYSEVKEIARQADISIDETLERGFTA